MSAGHGRAHTGHQLDGGHLLPGLSCPITTLLAFSRALRTVRQEIGVCQKLPEKQVCPVNGKILDACTEQFQSPTRGLLRSSLSAARPGPAACGVDTTASQGFPRDLDRFSGHVGAVETCRGRFPQFPMLCFPETVCVIFALCLTLFLLTCPKFTLQSLFPSHFCFHE